MISELFQAIDAAWQPPEPAPVVLRLIGSTALMLQTDYARGTKDSDVLETAELPAATRKRLLANDIRDVEAMVARELVSPALLVDRFRAAMDFLLGDAREENLPTYVRNLHRVERDLLGVEETEIELPGRLA